MDGVGDYEELDFGGAVSEEVEDGFGGNGCGHIRGLKGDWAIVGVRCLGLAGIIDEKVALAIPRGYGFVSRRRR